MIDRRPTWSRPGLRAALFCSLLTAVWSADSATASEDFQVNLTTKENQDYPDVAYDNGGRFLIGWTSMDTPTGDEAVRARIFEGDGAPASGEIGVGSPADVWQNEAHVCGLAGGGWLLAWRSDTATTGGVRAQKIAVDGSLSGAEIVVSSDSLPTDPFYRVSNNLDVACLPDGGFFVGWSEGFAPDYVSVMDFDVHGQRFDSAGAPVGASFVVNENTVGDQGNFGAVAVESSPDGKVLVVWSSGCPFGTSSAGCPIEPDGSASSAQARLIAADGTPGSEFRVNTTTAGTQGSHGVAAAFTADGSFAIAWYDGDRNASSCGGWLPCGDVVAQIYAADGTPVDGEFRVNAVAGGRHLHPVVSHDEDGGFLFVWEKLGPGPKSKESVSARRFTSNGTPRGGDFVVTSNNPRGDRDPSIAAHGGNYAVTWSDFSAADGSAIGVFARVISLANPGCPETLSSDCRMGNGKVRAALDDNSGETRVKWRWQKDKRAGDLRSLEGTLGYAMCFYDEAGALAQSAVLSSDARCGSGSCWNVQSGKELYLSPGARAAGLRRVVLSEGDDAGSIQTRTQGLSVAPKTAKSWTAQFHGNDGRCWESVAPK